MQWQSSSEQAYPAAFRPPERPLELWPRHGKLHPRVLSVANLHLEKRWLSQLQKQSMNERLNKRSGSWLRVVT